MRRKPLQSTELMSVTPDQARAWWATRQRHRHHREDHAQRLADAMRCGEFRAGDGRPVSIINGILANGQHRVRAVIITGEPQMLCVSRMKVV